MVKREENQRKKDNLLLKDSIIDKRTPYWKMLLDNGLITQTKFYRLIKRKMLETDSEKIEFVNRQLVETRQITKYVTNLIKNHYENTEVYAIRAGVTSEIRSKYGLFKNRNVNDYHHAHDAYLLCVVGNIIEKNLKYKDEYLFGEYVKRYFKENEEKDTTKDGYGALVGLISKHINPQKIKKVLAYKDCYLSRMLEEETGEFYNQTLYKKRHGLIRKKDNLPTEIYGGYTNTNKAYMSIYSYKDKKGKLRCKLIGIPIKISTDIKNKKTTLEKYIQDEILADEEYTEFKIIREKMLLSQQYLDKEGNPFRLVSAIEIKSEKPLIVGYNLNKFIHLINGNLLKLSDDDKKFITEYSIKAYDELLEIFKKQYKFFSSISKKLEDNREEYINLNENDKYIVINELLKTLKTNNGKLNLLGFSKETRLGRMEKKTFNERNLYDMTFIDKSVTGIYERRYKINGVEDDISK